MSTNEPNHNCMERIYDLADINSETWDEFILIQSVDPEALDLVIADLSVDVSINIMRNIGAKIAQSPMLFATNFMLVLISHLRYKVLNTQRRQEDSQSSADGPGYNAPRTADDRDSISPLQTPPIMLPLSSRLTTPPPTTSPPPQTVPQAPVAVCIRCAARSTFDIYLYRVNKLCVCISFPLVVYNTLNWLNFKA